jgi:putative transposase
MIKKNIKSFPVRMMCKVLCVSSSGYYDWHDRPASLRAQENIVLASKIQAIFDEEKSRCGAKRITKRLNSEGVCIGRHRVARIMRQSCWRAKAACGA